MTRNLLASSDIVATFKLLAMKICLVIISSALNGVGRLQVVLMLILAFITVHHQLWQVGECRSRVGHDTEHGRQEEDTVLWQLPHAFTCMHVGQNVLAASVICQ